MIVAGNCGASSATARCGSAPAKASRRMERSGLASTATARSGFRFHPITFPVSLLWFGVVGEEQLLTIDLIAGDCVLTLPRGEPIDERHTQICLYFGIPCWVHEHDCVLVEEARIVVDDYFQVAAIVEVDPIASIGQRIAIYRRCHSQRLFHA